MDAEELLSPRILHPEQLSPATALAHWRRERGISGATGRTRSRGAAEGRRGGGGAKP
eukprot:COSAG01_NODE_6003_length_3907_cov_4.487132_3_plen_57_part_00